MTAVNEMITALKAKEACIRITPSKLVAWIVEHYKQGAFESEQEQIIRAHFNSKEYLKRVMNGVSTEGGIAEALETALKRIRAEGSSPPVVQRRRRKSIPTDATTNAAVTSSVSE